MTRYKSLLLLPIFLLLAVACDQTNQPSTSKVSPLTKQITVINIWAEWCKPCVKETPAFNALAEANSDIAVIGINFDELEGDELAAAMKTLNMQFTAWPMTTLEQLGIAPPRGLPTTFVFNANQELVETLVGPQTLETLQATVNSIQ